MAGEDATGTVMVGSREGDATRECTGADLPDGDDIRIVDEFN